MITVISQLIEEQITSGVYHGASLALYQDGSGKTIILEPLTEKSPSKKAWFMI